MKDCTVTFVQSATLKFVAAPCGVWQPSPRVWIIRSWYFVCYYVVLLRWKRFTRSNDSHPQRSNLVRCGSGRDQRPRLLQ